MLKWSQRALAVIPHFFRSLQDLDIYVEDTGDEVFYTQLFRRIAPPGVRIERIFTENGKPKVIEKAKHHDFGVRRALFIVDGDFPWVRGEPTPTVRGLHQFAAYCVENLIISEAAAIQILIEEASVDEVTAKQKLDFQAWSEGIREPLVDLFIAFAVLNLVKPESPTVSRGIGTVLTAAKKGGLPSLDPEKAAELKRKIRREATQVVGAAVVKDSEVKIRSRIKKLRDPLLVVSGKDFLLPLFEYQLWKCAKNFKTHRSALRVRLARHCDPELFLETSKAMKAALRSRKR